MGKDLLKKSVKLKYIFIRSAFCDDDVMKKVSEQLSISENQARSDGFNKTLMKSEELENKLIDCLEILEKMKEHLNEEEMSFLEKTYEDILRENKQYV